MIPTINEQFLQDFEVADIPSRDFALDIENSKINGTVEELDAVKQAIYFILNTERYDHIIYPWEYGVELDDLFGQPSSYVIPEIERRITEALTQDDRIVSVGSFEFTKIKKGLHVSFVVSTIYGEIESEVDVNV